MALALSEQSGGALGRPQPALKAAPFAKRVKRAVRYALVRAAVAAISALPVRVAGWFGEWLGAAAFFLAALQRRRAMDGVALAFPEKSQGERVALVRASFRHLGRCALEMCCVRQIDRAIDQWVELPAEARAVLQRAVEKKKGVVFVSGHVGQWELLGRRLAAEGFRGQTIAKEPPDPRLARLIEHFRTAGQIRIIWRGRDGAAKQMLRVLRDGEVLAMFIDQDTKVQSVFVPFFGHPASTPRAAADLALRSGAAVVVGFCQRGADGRYRVVLSEVTPPVADRTEAAVVALTAELTAHIERAIRQTPEQWVWMHRRWRTSP